MRHLATYLLLVLGGNAHPTAGDVTQALQSVGVEVDSERLEKLIADLDGKDVNQLIAEGRSKLASFGGGGSVSVATTTTSSTTTASSGKDAGKKEEKKEEKKEDESAGDIGGMNMFGGGGGDY